MQKMQCSPNVSVENHYTCFTYEELAEIAKAINSQILSNSKVCSPKACALMSPIPEPLPTDKYILWKSIYECMKPVCDYETCWVETSIVDSIGDDELASKIRYFTFKPKFSKSQRGWISTRDIKDVMKQFEFQSSQFAFAGALPSDFWKLTSVDYSLLLNKEYLGFVLNLDSHKQGGSHWVALFIDNVNRTIEYFDSTGDAPNKNIKTFISKVRSELPDYKYLENKVVHQIGNRECGVYAMFFLISRLRGYSFSDISAKPIRDKHMSEFRNELFRMS
jgi:hypothetical protein